MMLVKENLPIIIDHHPFHESLNTKILNETANVSYEKGGTITGNKLSVKRASYNTTAIEHVRGSDVKGITSADNALIEGGDDFGFSGN